MSDAKGGPTFGLGCDAVLSGRSLPLLQHDVVALSSGSKSELWRQQSLLAASCYLLPDYTAPQPKSHCREIDGHLCSAESESTYS
jgi:hypothetical protein